MSEQQAGHSIGQSEAVPNSRLSGVRFPADISDAFDHLFAIGLASILEVELNRTVRLSWHSRREVVIDAGPDITGEHVGQIVHKHATRHMNEEWLTGTIEVPSKKGSTTKSPLSPRIGAPATGEFLEVLELRRHDLVDEIQGEDWLVLRLLGALGRPADWAEDKKHQILLDRGASAWEMKARNGGGDFIHGRLDKIASSVSRRKIEAVNSGLKSLTLRDEVDGKLDSRTPTGLCAPRPTDNARAWCALWGISAFPVQPVTGQSESKRQFSTTAGALRGSTPDAEDPQTVWFFIPVAEQPQTVAALRAAIRSGALARQALLVVRAGASAGRAATSRDFDWLEEHGIRQFVLFERAKSDNANAPELYALPGRTVQTARIPPVSAAPLKRGSRQDGKRRGTRAVSQGVI